MLQTKIIITIIIIILILEGGINFVFRMFTGHYMYIETSLPRSSGDNAKLEISVSRNGELSCVEFYYHMYGDHMGTLNVYSGNLLVFRTSGNHGNHWKKALVNIHLDNIVSFNPFHAYI